MDEEVNKSDGVPENFREVVRPMIEAALLEQPEDVIGFAANYFEEELKQKENECCGSGEMNIHGSTVCDKQSSKDENNSPKSENRSPKARDFEMNVDNQDDLAASLEFSTNIPDRVLSTVSLETTAPSCFPNTAFSEHSIKTEKPESHTSSPTDGTHVMKLHSKQAVKFGDYLKLLKDFRENSVAVASQITCNRSTKTDGCVVETRKETETASKMFDNEKSEAVDKSSCVEQPMVAKNASNLFHASEKAIDIKGTGREENFKDIPGDKVGSPNGRDGVQFALETSGVQLDQALDDDQHTISEVQKLPLITVSPATENEPENAVSPLYADGTGEISRELGQMTDSSNEFCAAECSTDRTEGNVLVNLRTNSIESEEGVKMAVNKSLITEFPSFLEKEKADNVDVQKPLGFQTSKTTEEIIDTVVGGSRSAPEKKLVPHSTELTDHPSLQHRTAKEEKDEECYFKEVHEALQELLDEVAASDTGKLGCQENCERNGTREEKPDGVVTCPDVYADHSVTGIAEEKKPHPIREKIATTGQGCAGSTPNFAAVEVHRFGEERFSPLKKTPRMSNNSLISWETRAQRYKEWMDRNKNLSNINPKYNDISFRSLQPDPPINRTGFGGNIPCGVADCSGNWCHRGAQPKVFCFNGKKQWDFETLSGWQRTTSCFNYQSQGKENQSHLQSGATKLLEVPEVKDESECEDSPSRKRMKQRVSRIFMSPLSSERTSSEHQSLPLQSSRSHSNSGSRIPTKRKCGTTFGFITMEGDAQITFAPEGIKTEAQRDSEATEGRTTTTAEESGHEKSLISPDEKTNEVAGANCVQIDEDTWKDYPIVLCDDDIDEDSNPRGKELKPKIVNLDMRDINNNTILVEAAPQKDDAEWQRMEDNEIFLQSLNVQEADINATCESSDDRNTMCDHVQEPGENICNEASERYFNIESGDYDDDYVIIEDMINQKGSLVKKSSSLSERSSSDERTNIDSADSGEGINAFDTNSMKSLSKDTESHEKMLVGEGGDMPANGTGKPLNEQKKDGLNQSPHGMFLLADDMPKSKRASDSGLNLKTPCALESSESSAEERRRLMNEFHATTKNERDLLGTQLELADVNELLKTGDNWANSGNSTDVFENIKREISAIDALEEAQDMALYTEGGSLHRSNSDEAIQEEIHDVWQTNEDKNEEEENDVGAPEKCEMSSFGCMEIEQKTSKWPLRDILKPCNTNGKWEGQNWEVSSEGTSKCVGNAASNIDVFSAQTSELECCHINENCKNKALENEDGATKSTCFSEEDFSHTAIEPKEEKVTAVTEAAQEITADKNGMDVAQEDTGNNFDQAGSENTSHYENSIENPSSRNDGETNEDSHVMTIPVPVSRIFARDKLPPLIAEDRFAGFIRIVDYQETDDSEDLSSGPDDSEHDQDTKE